MKPYSSLLSTSELLELNLVFIGYSNMAYSSFFAYCLLLVSLGLAVLGCATPYWTVNDNPPASARGRYHQGLFAACEGDLCVYYFDHFELAKGFPDWFKATQGLMSIGLGLGLLALLIATLSLCCGCNNCNLNQPICGLLIVACISMGAGICIFGVKAKDDWSVELEWSGLSTGRFGWSFWVGIGASALSFLTGCMYGCMGRKQN